MTVLESLIIYICLNYPYGNELSKARLTKLIYLMDWESCKASGNQLTSIRWFFHNYGPYVDDVVNEAKRSHYLNVAEELNFYGDKKEIIYLTVNNVDYLNLNNYQIGIANQVLNYTRSMFWNDFIDYVYSTPPVANANRYDILDLVTEAQRLRHGDTFPRF